eukprot:TRINITY_DN3123_c0_g2_i1.p1 TRINITY_DN3123_c0_g2~~TRINITY_DN3123_c0_g2_i1.p1  ORF type:complete len:197 (+),score=9.77 TRINITY_DN3123_c0_g2_i1:26-592(+)
MGETYGAAIDFVMQKGPGPRTLQSHWREDCALGCQDSWGACRKVPISNSSVLQQTIDRCTRCQEGPVHVAVRLGSVDMVQHMVECHDGCMWINYVSPPAPVGRGAAPLHIAAATGNVLMVMTLLRLGASVFQRNSDQLTPLEVAMSRQRDDIARALMGASPEPDNFWETPEGCNPVPRMMPSPVPPQV